VAGKAAKKVDVAVIGGGVAGCYFAARHGEAYPDRSVGVFEASARVGGRLRSETGDGQELPIELGALSFNGAHENLLGLLSWLGLETTPIEFVRERYYLRGRRLSEASFSDGALTPYQLSAGEDGKPPLQLLLYALSRIAPDLDRLWPFAPVADPSATVFYLRKLHANGMPLWRQSFWSVLTNVLSHEAFALIGAGFGNCAPFGAINAYDAIWTLLWEAQSSKPHFRLMRGYQSLPLALKETCGPNVSFSARFRLTQVRTLPQGFRLHFTTATGEDSVDADALVLALPRRAIERIGFDEELIGECFYRDLRSVEPIVASKLFLRFDCGWAQREDLVAPSPSVSKINAAYTDLPLRQCYWHAPSARDDACWLMASFADQRTAPFWSAFAPGCAEESAATPADELMRAPASMIESARKQLAAVYGRADFIEPSKAFYVDWGASPHSGAWHAWSSGVKSWEVRSRIRAPNPKRAFFICGETFAQAHGWVEQTINDVEVCLERHFGVARPNWVRADYPFEH
jgi:monoamine oxidase